MGGKEKKRRRGSPLLIYGSTPMVINISQHHEGSLNSGLSVGRSKKRRFATDRNTIIAIYGAILFFTERPHGSPCRALHYS